MSGLSRLKTQVKNIFCSFSLFRRKCCECFYLSFVGFELVWSGNSRQAFAVRDRNFTSTYERICRIIWQQWASEIHHWALGHSAFLTKGSHLVSLGIMMFHTENFTSWATSCFLQICNSCFLCIQTRAHVVSSKITWRPESWALKSGIPPKPICLTLAAQNSCCGFNVRSNALEILS